MRIAIIISLFCTLLLTSSCANRAQTGAVGGAAAGAVIGQAIGHNTGATLIGAAVGTLLGYIVGNEMDKYDRVKLNQVYEQAPSNQRTEWVNPDNGNQYTVTPQPAYQNPQTNQYCRKAEIQAMIDGRQETTYSTACRDDYGQWHLR